MAERRVETERELDLQARVIALEYLVKHCLVLLMTLPPQDDEYDGADFAVLNAKRLRAQARKALRKVAVSASDPATSDHLADLVYQHADLLLDEVTKYL